MHISENDPLEENRHLRRTMRDLVALSTLPAMWIDLGPEGVARSLADVLFNTLSLDLLYVRLQGLMGDGAVEVVRTKHGSDAAHVEVVRTSLAPILNSEGGDPPSTISNPFADGTLHVAVTRFGLAGDFGVLVTASENAEYPTERDRLLVGVGANQTAIVIQRWQAEEQVREQGERLRTTLASIGDAVITTDTQGQITNLNAVAESLTGWTNTEAVGQPLDVVFHIVNEQTRQSVENPATRALREGTIVGLANHTILIAKDGTERPIDDSAAPIRCKEGEVVGCVLVFRDVSEKRKADVALRDSEALKTAMFQTALDCIISMNHEGKVTEFNAAAERTFGFRREDVLGRELANLIIPPALRERHRRGMAHYLATGEGPVLNQRLQLTAVRSDGSEFPVEMSVTRIPTDGPPLFAAYVRDITDQKRAEQERQEGERRFRMVIEQVKDYAIFTTDTQGRATSWNEGVRRVLGFEEAEFIGQDIAPMIFIPEDLENGVAEKELKVAAETGSASNDRWMRRKDGTRFFALGVTTAQQDEASRLVGFTKIMRDQTDRKRLEDELRQSAAELSEADRRKNEFLAMLAHELRNPLAPIRTGLEIMKVAKDDPATLEEIHSTMERQTQQLISLVDDLLDVSRITTGKLELRKCQVKLTDVIQSAVEASRPFVVEAGHELTVVTPDEPIYLNADPNRLAQVLSNLLNNSTKYTPEGGRIHLFAVRQGSDVTISVEDNGLGIPPEMLERIFEMFAQIDRPMEKGYTGLGIGLSLVKSLVEMHDGSIEVHSEGAGKGSVFSVRLPILEETLGDNQIPSRTDDTAKQNIKRKVLIVDDNKAAATMLSMVVKMLGNEVCTAHDGQEAIDVAAEFLPDVILLDIGMPKMNGYEAARHIRKQPWGNSMMLVALTGWGQEEDRKKTNDAGFDHHLVKPADPATLQQLLASYHSKPI